MRGDVGEADVDVEIGMDDTGVVRPSVGVGNLLGVALRPGMTFSSCELALVFRLCDDIGPVVDALIFGLEGLMAFSMSPLWIVARPGRLLVLGRGISERVESMDCLLLRCDCGDSSDSSRKLAVEVEGEELTLEVLRIGCRRRCSKDELRRTPPELDVMLAWSAEKRLTSIDARLDSMDGRAVATAECSNWSAGIERSDDESLFDGDRIREVVPLKV